MDPVFQPWIEIEELLQTGNPVDIDHAIDKALETMPESLALTLIRSLCFHADFAVRDGATSVLAEFGKEEDLFRILLLTRDPEWIVRCTAVDSLTEYKDPKARARLLTMVRRDKQHTVREWAIRAIVEHTPDDEVVTILKELAQQEKHPFPLIDIYGGLIRLGYKEYLPELKKLADDKSIRLRPLRRMLVERVEERIRELEPVPGCE